MLIVGLTGGMGVGKSTVAELLGRRGAHVIDVDAIGRRIVGPGGAAVDAVVERFGADVQGPDSGIDRAALAAKVFADEGELAALNLISHPIIDDEMDREIDEFDDDAIVILDMAVLVESELGRHTRHPYEVVVTVEAPLEIRLDRLEERGVTRDDARARIENQVSDEDRRSVAQYVIANGGDLDSLSGAVGELWGELQRLHELKRS